MEPECVRTPSTTSAAAVAALPCPSEEEEGVAVEEEVEVVTAAAAVVVLVVGHRGLPWCGWAELVSKVKMLGARGVGRDERAAASLSLPPFISALEWAGSSDDFLRLDLLARPLLLCCTTTGDLERDRDLELERERFLFLADLALEEEEEEDEEEGVVLSFASSESFVSFVALLVLVVTPLDDCFA